MTRDEATKIWEKAIRTSPENSAVIDAFVALGVLTLDEPKSVRQRAIERIMLHAGCFDCDAKAVLLGLDKEGLRIVEK